MNHRCCVKNPRQQGKCLNKQDFYGLPESVPPVLKARTTTCCPTPQPPAPRVVLQGWDAKQPEQPRTQRKQGREMPLPCPGVQDELNTSILDHMWSALGEKVPSSPAIPLPRYRSPTLTTTPSFKPSSLPVDTFLSNRANCVSPQPHPRFRPAQVRRACPPVPKQVWADLNDGWTDARPMVNAEGTHAR